jgi:hypothetical protein
MGIFEEIQRRDVQGRRINWASNLRSLNKRSKGICHHLSVTFMTCFLPNSPIPITQITSGCIILDKNVSFLYMNDLFKMNFHFLQVIPKGCSPSKVPGDGMCSPHGKSLRDGHGLPSAICTNLQFLNLVFPVLYALLFMDWTWSRQCYMHQSPWDELGLQKMELVSPVLYTPLSMWWTWSPQCYMYRSLKDGRSLPSVMCTTLHQRTCFSGAICTTLQVMYVVSLVLYALISNGWMWSF